ncbi:hypothetical protein [Amycolatopsis sp.]|jgi:hypothetical protein|uniref:hypothetical protein n=1 Tax=Amycolatopsis sp. TaxID=37632 RepID=UPI002DF7B78D|nr:hypothetical protein [Amycolatopsis sp.]
MEHNDVTNKGSGPGLSTQDLLDAEPGGDHRLAEVPPEDEIRDESLPGAHDEPVDELGDEPLVDDDVPGDEITDVPQEEVVAAPRGDSSDEPMRQLFADQDVDRFRQDWQAIQIAFVDDPKRAVSEADELVASVIQSLAATFASHKSDLESQWRQGEAATEDLRVALRRYRSFFNQLLST